MQIGKIRLDIWHKCITPDRKDAALDAASEPRAVRYKTVVEPIKEVLGVVEDILFVLELI